MPMKRPLLLLGRTSSLYPDILTGRGFTGFACLSSAKATETVTLP
jgi:hypothetical protein